MTVSSLPDALARLSRSREALRVAVDRVVPDRRDRPPAPDRWSVAAVLEHLALVEERYTTLLSTALASATGTAAAENPGRAGELPPTMEATLADRSARRSAPEAVHPRGLPWSEALARAEAARAAVRALLAQTDPELSLRVVYEHPRFGALTVCQWGHFLAAHEARHTEQVYEIAAQVRDETLT